MRDLTLPALQHECRQWKLLRSVKKKFMPGARGQRGPLLSETKARTRGRCHLCFERREKLKLVITFQKTMYVIWRLDWFDTEKSIFKSKMNWINCDYINPEQNLSPTRSRSCQKAFEICPSLDLYIPPENNSSYLFIHRKTGPVCPTFNFFKECSSLLGANSVIFPDEFFINSLEVFCHSPWFVNLSLQSSRPRPFLSFMSHEINKRLKHYN